MLTRFDRCRRNRFVLSEQRSRPYHSRDSFNQVLSLALAPPCSVVAHSVRLLLAVAKLDCSYMRSRQAFCWATALLGQPEFFAPSLLIILVDTSFDSLICYCCMVALGEVCMPCCITCFPNSDHHLLSQRWQHGCHTRRVSAVMRLVLLVSAMSQAMSACSPITFTDPA